MWERLWRRTVTLAREYPALWLPVIFADLAGFGFGSSRRAAILSVVQLVRPMFHGHSVLVGSTGPEYTDSARAVMLIIASFIGAVFQAAPLVLYTSALFITARMVWARAELRESGENQSVGRKIAALSMRVVPFAWALWALTAFLGAEVMRSRWRVEGIGWTIFLETLTGLNWSVFAYVMVPPAMRLLTDSTIPVDKHSIRLGRKCAFGAVIASAGIMILEKIILGFIYASRAEITPILALASLIAAVPYVPLYITLGLLVRDQPPELAKRILR